MQTWPTLGLHIGSLWEVLTPGRTFAWSKKNKQFWKTENVCLNICKGKQSPKQTRPFWMLKRRGSGKSEKKQRNVLLFHQMLHAFAKAWKFRPCVPGFTSRRRKLPADQDCLTTWHVLRIDGWVNTLSFVFLQVRKLYFPWSFFWPLTFNPSF